jgi:hypothetical protein
MILQLLRDFVLISWQEHTVLPSAKSCMLSIPPTFFHLRSFTHLHALSSSACFLCVEVVAEHQEIQKRLRPSAAPETNGAESWKLPEVHQNQPTYTNI